MTLQPAWFVGCERRDGLGKHGRTMFPCCLCPRTVFIPTLLLGRSSRMFHLPHADLLILYGVRALALTTPVSGSEKLQFTTNDRLRASALTGAVARYSCPCLPLSRMTSRPILRVRSPSDQQRRCRTKGRRSVHEIKAVILIFIVGHFENIGRLNNATRDTGTRSIKLHCRASLRVPRARDSGLENPATRR
ncbi:hypothetical protein BDW71DRAFT_21185 [Aspergillus fruticulosus]